ncbi:MAG: hypothetical protein GF368_01105 [Candidatus Aenigmarchaeota archaeon]|nr:hypothetical protein [Candidatus Aenigmarchaeota archaeon]
MGLFKKKKPEERPKTDIHEIKKAVGEEETFPKTVAMKEVEEEIVPKKSPKRRPEEVKKKDRFAPLFVKIDRYNSVLNLLNDLKATTMMVKNAMVVQKEIEVLAEENRKLIEDGVKKIDNKLLSLDAEFIRPKGFREELESAIGKPELDSVVDDLKTQVENLKLELNDIS